MRTILTLLRMELMRLSRTSQTYTTVILPALLLLPTAVFVGLVVLSLENTRTVAMPDPLADDLSLAGSWSEALRDALEDAGLRVVQTPDPDGAWQAGEVDAAILSVRAGDGLDRAHPKLELASQDAIEITVEAVDPDLQDRVSNAVHAAGQTLLAEWVIAAGGEPERDLVVARTTVLDFPRPPPFSKQRAAWAYVVFVVSMVGFFFCSLTGVADRNEGVTETLLATPVRATSLLTARMGAVLVLQLIACLLLVANVVLLARGMGRTLPLPPLAPGMVLSLLGGTALCDAIYLLVGTWSPNAKAANNIGGAAMLGVIALLALGVLADAPAWLPLAGIGAARTGMDHAIAGLSCALATVLVVGATAARLERRVDLKLSTEQR